MLEAAVQPQKEVQPNRMEIDMVALRVAYARRRTTMLDKATLLERGI
jgi:hypothetical protein